MERLSIEEVIEHCNKTCDMTERIAKARGHELESIESKQFWEHYQVREWLNELIQYRAAEEQGLLLRLPVPIGEEVYCITNKLDVQGISKNRVLSYKTAPKEVGGIIARTYTGTNLGIVGKNVFATLEEAEQKLASMKKGE